MATRIASDAYLALVSIHPLWDGNGRTAKIMRDWILLHLKIPPPAFTPENDLELTPKQAVDELRKGIEETRSNIDLNNGKIEISNIGD